MTMLFELIGRYQQGTPRSRDKALPCTCATARCPW